MADNKKYYYLKLKENFFDSDELIILESMQDGYLYSNILLKLYLRSLKNEGRLMFNDRIPFNSTMLAQVTRHSVGVVEKAMKIFQELGLVEVLDNGAIYMLDIQNFIGKSSTEADRIREYRSRIENEKKPKLQNLYKCTPEIELDIEKEKEIKKELDIDKDKKSIIQIVNYLNDVSNSNYRSSSKKTRSLINARLNEGFKVEDFKKVIDNKCKEWKGTEFEKYLRPETLFGTKFESYLNQKNFINQKNNLMIENNYSELNTYSQEEIERIMTED